MLNNKIKAIIYKKNRQIVIKKLDPKSDSFEYKVNHISLTKKITIYTAKLPCIRSVRKFRYL